MLVRESAESNLEMTWSHNNGVLNTPYPFRSLTWWRMGFDASTSVVCIPVYTSRTFFESAQTKRNLRKGEDVSRSSCLFQGEYKFDSSTARNQALRGILKIKFIYEIF